MKKSSLSSPHGSLASPGLLAGLALAICLSAGAQNFVRNPDFEEPLGPDNWTVVYAPVVGGAFTATNCGPYDFLYAGRSIMAHKDIVPGTWDGEDGTGKNYWDKYGGHFAPNHTWIMHAYFRQVVTNLIPGSNYACSAWMANYTQNDNHITKANVYLETLGGVNMNVSRRTADATLNAYNNPSGWQRYTVTNTASSLGRIELRMHFNKFGTTAHWEWRNFNAFYDHVAVVPIWQPAQQLPPYKVLSLARSNENLSLAWETVMNNRYRIQYATNLSTPTQWYFVKRNPKLDTNFFATASSFTFKTNLLSMFSFDPSFNPQAPLYFRIHSTPFVP